MRRANSDLSPATAGAPVVDMNSVLQIFVVFVSSCWLIIFPATAAEKPNVLLIMVDDMGFSDLGCYGGEVETPNLDKLAAGGLRFTQFYNPGRCWPTRISLLTGKYPHQAGHAMKFGPNAPRAYAGHTPDQGKFVSEALNEAGYRSYHVGKWHMDSNLIKGPPNPTHPLQRGFAHSYWILTQHNFFNPWRLQDDENIIQWPAGKDNPAGDGKYYLTDDLTDRAIAQLREHAAGHADQPFFLYLAHTAPHFPLHALPEDIELHMDGRYAKGWDAIRAERHARMTKMGIVNCGLSTRDEESVPWDSLGAADQKKWETHMAIHAGMIHRVDLGVGRIVDHLRESGMLEGTLILFLSDNGASAEYLVRGDGHDPAAPPGSGASYLCLEVGWANASNTPFRQHKMWTHEGGISTPLIAHWPSKIAARGELSGQVGHVIDIMPTLCDLAGAQAPEGPGSSLAPVFAGEEREPPEFLHWEHTGNRAIRRGDWKLVAEHGGDWELYDLKTDRAETNDLSKKHPELVQLLLAKWTSYADEIGVVDWDSLPQSKASPSADYRKK